ncbi:oxidoreductase [Flavobacterium akiainvivens]|uniref:Oxidoreductase n=1 Tax=Flavobacterium akiainvivens TaxID=1202724 RepID=A0A0M8MJ14_9FLAO|nr:Gfo/Idh/MocA family oxidoreductase [Flavobacterium akiainvivens]KOS07211.1 oxidoreductase [Flavobacterium akiainvivens]SFQ78328.1 Predicted dehydrogenase [Flavobacterium akiainvivens]
MKKIKTALLSYGMSGKVFHAPFLTLHPGFELTGAWERSKDLIRQDYPNVKRYESIEELLADDVDLVVVNTPVDTHYEYAKQAIAAGKHTLVEKAFTTTAAEAKELGELAKAKGVTLTVYQNRRWDSDFLTVKQVLESGVLGDIVEAEIRFDRYNPILSPKAWKESANAGAGVLKDLGPHIIDQALALFGKPDSVFADIRTLREGSVVDDNIDILLYYPNKRVRLHAGFFNKELLPSYVLQGREGSFFKDRGDIQEDTLKTGAKPNLDNWGTEPEDKSGLLHYSQNGESIRKTIPTLKGNYYGIFDGVYNAITQGIPEPVTAQDGLLVMQIIDAAIESDKEKKAINL